MGNTFGFEMLEVWKKTRVFKSAVCRFAKALPSEEKFRLTDQLIRSSRAIKSLLAEGHGRFTYSDQLHFCVQARGSLAETINHLIDAYDEKYISYEKLDAMKLKGKIIELLLNGYIRSLMKMKSPL
jgi:four helix bundle protein